MKLKIIDTAHHRNGVAGAGFDVVLFKVLRESATKVGILFDDPGYCAVLDVTLLAAGDIAFGSNSWRGDHYEPHLRRLVQQPDGNAEPSGTDGTALIRNRVTRCSVALHHYSDDELFTNLIDLLADARHWCDATGEDFDHALAVAGRNYLAELNDEKTDERKLP